MKYFKPEEFACKHCGKNIAPQDFMNKCDRLRSAYGHPLTISSGYRCPDHNAKVSSTGRNGPHTTGRAVDFAVARSEAFKLLKLAMESGEFTGIGVNQKGGGRFLHLDDLTPLPDRPRPTLWSY